jgi:uncharacterized protein (DUF58 family)
MTDGTQIRVAVAEEEKEDVLAPRLGRAVKFALFDLRGGEVRGPSYRVRHDNPGVAGETRRPRALPDTLVLAAGRAGGAAHADSQPSRLVHGGNRPPAMPIVLTYTTTVYYIFRGKVKIGKDSY